MRQKHFIFSGLVLVKAGTAEKRARIRRRLRTAELLVVRNCIFAATFNHRHLSISFSFRNKNINKKKNEKYFLSVYANDGKKKNEEETVQRN